MNPAVPASENPMRRAMRLQQEGRYTEAEALYRQILSANSHYAPALSFLGLIECDTGRPDGIVRLAEAVELEAGLSILWLNYGLGLQHRGQLPEAETALRRAIALEDGLYEAHLALARLLYRCGRFDDAALGYRKVVSLRPQQVDGYINLGGALNESHAFEQAMAVLETGDRLAPGHPQVNLLLGYVLAAENRMDAAVARFRAAARARPGFAVADWNAALALPVIYERQEEIADWRQRWSDNLATLEASIDLSTRSTARAALDAATSSTNFRLHYQGGDDRELQQRYARLIHRIVEACYPAYCEPLSRRLAGRDRLRVGFMSHYFRLHSIAKTHAAWATRLDRTRFETFVIHTGGEQDGFTRYIADRVEHFHHKPIIDDALYAFVRGLDLDVLIYPDLGMEPAYQILAAMRLAPVQCNGLGHPVTSGLETIDVALSSQLMEPPSAENRYSERLVPLANLGFCYRRPAIDFSVSFDRGGAPIVYACPQYLMKLLPEQDVHFARIAKEVPTSVFWFVANESAAVTRQFETRLARAFADAGVAVEGRIRMLPRLTQQAFYAMYRAADVALDGHAWSGCNTTFEAIACGLPVVTWPGSTMRSRHSAAILRHAGLDAMIADSAEGYVGLAAALGSDMKLRKEARDSVLERAPGIFDDPTPIESLAAFLETMTGRA
jgi:protein O-GlcNAc transferase